MAASPTIEPAASPLPTPTRLPPPPSSTISDDEITAKLRAVFGRSGRCGVADLFDSFDVLDIGLSRDEDARNQQLVQIVQAAGGADAKGRIGLDSFHRALRMHLANDGVHLLDLRDDNLSDCEALDEMSVRLREACWQVARCLTCCCPWWCCVTCCCCSCCAEPPPPPRRTAYAPIIGKQRMQDESLPPAPASESLLDRAKRSIVRPPPSPVRAVPLSPSSSSVDYHYPYRWFLKAPTPRRADLPDYCAPSSRSISVRGAASGGFRDERSVRSFFSTPRCASPLHHQPRASARPSLGGALVATSPSTPCIAATAAAARPAVFLATGAVRAARGGLQASPLQTPTPPLSSPARVVRGACEA